MNRLAPFVGLCRAAEHRLAEARIELKLHATPKVLAMLTEAYEIDINRDLEVKVGGNLFVGDYSSINIGAQISVSAAMGGNDFHVARSFADLLAYQGGQFQGTLPTEFYVLNEDVASFDAVIPKPDLAGYLRLPILIEMLRKLSDLEVTNRGTEFIFLANRRVVLPVRFDAPDAVSIPSEAKIAAVLESILCDPNREQRVQLFKNALAKFMEATVAEKRFGRMLARFDALIEAYKHDLQAFLTEFSHDRRREEFERKRLAHLQKINGAASDVWSKLLAFPIGQAVLVTQLKIEAGSEIANDAVLLGAIAFLVLGHLLLFAHGQALADLTSEIDEEVRSLEGRYDKAEVTKRFSGVRNRLKFIRYVPWLLCLLLWLGFTITLVKFLAGPSWVGGFL